MMAGKCPACGEYGLGCDRSEGCLSCGYGKLRKPPSTVLEVGGDPAPAPEPPVAEPASLVDVPVARAAFDGWWESRGGLIAPKPDDPDDEEAWDHFHLMYGHAWLAFIAGWRAREATP